MTAAKDCEVFVCGACGKTSKVQWKIGGGWDESCAMNSVLCREDSIVRRADGRVSSAKAVVKEEKSQ